MTSQNYKIIVKIWGGCTKLATWTKTDVDGDYVSLELDWPIIHSDQQYINISVWHR